MENKLELRMYGLVNYQLTGIQKGIQFGHAVVDYAQNVKIIEHELEKYNDWAKNWKTFIILNGGTTNNNPNHLGTLNQHLKTLKDNDIICQEFCEPDLGDQLTSVVFIVDERVFNREKYPDFDLKSFCNRDAKPNYSEIYKDPMNPIFPPGYPRIIKTEWDKWVESIGGQKNLFLRTFLKNFKLA